MAQLALTSAYKPKRIAPSALLARVSAVGGGIDRKLLKLRLQRYVASQRWTLGSLLASALLAIMTLLPGKTQGTTDDSVGDVLFGFTRPS